MVQDRSILTMADQ